MTRYLAAFGGAGLSMLVLDMIWLGFIAKPLYQEGIGHLMAPNPNVAVAALFYIVYAAGLVFFAVVPGARSPGWSATLGLGAFFGLVAYATYDLSNLATLRGWPPGLAAIDIAWGTVISAAAASCGRLAMQWLGKD
jgi:uncharacterized membrane protein